MSNKTIFNKMFSLAIVLSFMGCKNNADINDVISYQSNYEFSDIYENEKLQLVGINKVKESSDLFRIIITPYYRIQPFDDETYLVISADDSTTENIITLTYRKIVVGSLKSEMEGSLVIDWSKENSLGSYTEFFTKLNGVFNEEFSLLSELSKKNIKVIDELKSETAVLLIVEYRADLNNKLMQHVCGDFDDILKLSDSLEAENKKLSSSFEHLYEFLESIFNLIPHLKKPYVQ